ncbi:MAG: UDP-2,3-diacylglucosamine diphosphatase LpxI [Rhodospirillaceae bacterium]|jgi:UDP-2,3-diacylglucosamine hydrolase|nr:UDP-2,3-diacylglucosamine diphosphatase LpxI [Rhodospirillaceae bacterium]MBT6117046.1 UDP-2,3-diacylglucosamine diphosphatase LpxI [Rhodospirillaceae bacterium]
MRPKLGIVAGGGDLPVKLVAACRAAGREVFVLALEGQADPAAAEGVPHVWIRMGAAGKALKTLREAGVQDLVMAGRVRRPSLSELRPDWRATKLFAKLGASALGDDGLLSAVVRELEEVEGFRVTAPDELLGDLVAPTGPLGRHEPDDSARGDIARGFAVARALGALDVGQAVVVQGGLVLGVEAIEGTDALIARCATLRREGPGGVLVKTCKPGQERRVDLPTVGIETLRGAARAGLRGVAVEAGRSLILDRDAMIRMADESGLFLIGVDPATGVK